MPKNRSKRLRKKLRVGEFHEFVFLISFMLPAWVDQEALDDFTDRFLNEGIANNGLQFGGVISESIEGFVRLDRRGSVTEEHRALVGSWLAVDPLVADTEEIEIGELIDAKKGIRALNQVIQDEELQSRPGVLILPHII